MKLFFITLALTLTCYVACLAQITVLNSFNPTETGGYCGIGIDPVTGNIWVYDCNNNSIHAYAANGTLITSVPRPGGSTDDVDITFAPENFTLNKSNIPNGTLLFINGQSSTGTAEIYAIDKDTGAVIDTLKTQFGNNHVVGGGYHPIRNTFFLLQDNVPSTENENKIAEIDPVTGEVLSSFQVTGTFSIFYGDMEVNTATGNLFMVSSAEKGKLAQYTPEGELVQIHTLPTDLLKQSISGIAIDCEKEEAWIATTNGIIWHLGNFPCGVCPPIAINARSDGPVCNQDTLRLFADTVTNATYYWTGPNGFTDSLQNPVIVNVGVVDAGMYVVEVSLANCPPMLDSLAVVVNAIPDTFSGANNGPLCTGEALQLFADTVANATYRWTGPNGFSDSRQNPVITSVSANDAGLYVVEVSLGDCPATLDSTEVVINRVPETFSVTNNGPLCIGNELRLFADTVANATYHWTGPNGFSDSRQNPVITSVSANDGGMYFVEVSLGDCPSTSDSTGVVINALPDTFNAANNGPLCMGEDLQLFADTVANASYFWTGPGGFSDSQQNPTILQADELADGEYQITATIGGCSISAVTTTSLYDCCNVTVPDAFTPNGDHLNDVFELFAPCDPKDFEMKIFNRWGELMYFSNQMNNFWDGKYKGEDVKQGIYPWIMKYQRFNIMKNEYEEVIERGEVYVVGL